MIKRVYTVNSIIIVLSLGLFWAGNVSALALNMIRVDQPFPETLSALTKQINSMGYRVSRIQRVDYGLNKRGFKTDSYQIVFFGKYEEIKYLSNKYPELIPFLPLKIVIFAEGMDTLLLANNYYNLAEIFKTPELKTQFQKWRKDTAAIFSKVQEQ